MMADLSLAQVIIRIEQIRDDFRKYSSAGQSWEAEALDACLILLRQQQEQQQEIERLKALIIWPPSDSEAI
jgi:hypothetical protein